MVESRNIPGVLRNMHIYIYTDDLLHILQRGLWVFSRGDLDFCVGSTPLQVIEKESTVAGQRSETERGPERSCNGRRSPVCLPSAN